MMDHHSMISGAWQLSSGWTLYSNHPTCKCVGGATCTLWTTIGIHHVRKSGYHRLQDQFQCQSSCCRTSPRRIQPTTSRSAADKEQTKLLAYQWCWLLSEIWSPDASLQKTGPLKTPGELWYMPPTEFPFLGMRFDMFHVTIRWSTHQICVTLYPSAHYW